MVVEVQCHGSASDIEIANIKIVALQVLPLAVVAGPAPQVEGVERAAGRERDVDVTAVGPRVRCVGARSTGDRTALGVELTPQRLARFVPDEDREDAGRTPAVQ